MTPEDPLDGDRWQCDEVPGLWTDVHPGYLVDEEHLAIARLAFARAGATAPHLPFSGGLAEQPAITMAALLIAEDTVIRVRRPPQPRS